jgi:zinc protease
MKTIELPVAGDPSVTLLFAFRAGSQDDPPGKEGLAALTADLLTQGATERLAYEAILERLYPLATDYAATVDKELTTIGGRVHRDKLDEYVELLLDAILRPAFREDDFERLKSDAVNFIGNTLRYSSDEELGKAALTAATFPGTAYAHPVEGTIEGLTSITLDDIKAFYAANLVKARLTLGIAGGYDDGLRERLERELAKLGQGEPAAPPPIALPKPNGRRLVLIDKPGADASISFGHPLDIGRGERDFYALWLANSWLGEHRHGASHLFQVIRESRGLNYGDYSYIEAFPHGGELQMPPVNVPRRRQLFEVWLRTLPNDQAVFALRAALREVDRLVEAGLTAEQFELTRKFLKKYSTHYAPTTAGRLGYAIDDAFYGIDCEGHLARFARTMDELTRDEVNAAIRTHFQTRDLVIAIVTGDAEGLARALASGAPTPIEYPNPMAAGILAEDELIAAYPLEIQAGAIERWPVATVFAR